MSRSINRLFKAYDLENNVHLRVMVSGLSEAAFIRSYERYTVTVNHYAFARVTFGGAEILDGKTLEVLFTFDSVID